MPTDEEYDDEQRETEQCNWPKVGGETPQCLDARTLDGIGTEAVA